MNKKIAGQQGTRYQGLICSQQLLSTGMAFPAYRGSDDEAGQADSHARGAEMDAINFS